MMYEGDRECEGYKWPNQRRDNIHKVKAENKIALSLLNTF